MYQFPPQQLQTTCVTVMNFGGVDVITHLGVEGVLWTSGQVETAIANQTHVFFTLDMFGNRAWLQTVRSLWGSTILRTTADSSTSNNLLSLPRCL